MLGYVEMYKPGKPSADVAAAEQANATILAAGGTLSKAALIGTKEYNILGYEINTFSGISPPQLNPSTYTYYYTFLSDEEYPLPIRAAIGVVLIADLKMLYKSRYEQHKDKDLEKWGKVYLELSPADKRIADIEIGAFRQYIKANVSQYHSSSLFQQIRAARQNYFKNITADISDKEKEQLINQTMADEKVLIKKAQDKIAYDKNQKTNQEKIAKDYKEYMKNNIRAYLGGMYTMHKASSKMSFLMSELEFKVRLAIVKGVQSGQIGLQEGFNIYNNALDKLLDPNLNKYQYLKEVMPTLYKGIFKHPLARRYGTI